jgi:hypothetical protein
LTSVQNRMLRNGMFSVRWRMIISILNDWWLRSSSTNGEKGTCKNVSTSTLQLVFARGERKW